MSNIKNTTASASAMLCNSVDPMLDINRIKTEITELIFGPCDINPEGMSVDKFNFYAYARQRFSSLITTIESQQEKISELEMEMILTERVVTKKEEMLNDAEKRMSEVIESRDKALDEIESLKANTELAVKGLKWYADTDNHDNGYTRYDEDGLIKGVETLVEEDYGQLARNTLSEIEKLTNLQEGGK